jgi:Na+/H+ antiporter NhaD/arsenite permease-like protein
MIVLGVVSQEQAFHSIDWNVIFLLIGMMVIAGIMSETGLFQWIAVKAVQLEMSELISDQRLLIKSLIVLTGVILGFLVHGLLHLEPATIALAGAVVLMLWGRNDPHHLFRDIEWTTLFFFVGLFITVEAIVEVGIISQAAEAALQLTGGSLPITSMLILWLSAIVSGIIDNIPYTATMIPLVQDLGLTMPIMPLWWSLAMGACLGGNLTLVGAAANVVVANLAENSGHSISFKMFFQYGILITFISLVFASIYLWLRYLT